MQLGDAHEIVDAGACEYLPLLTRNGVLLAYRQRNQNTGICAIG